MPKIGWDKIRNNKQKHPEHFVWEFEICTQIHGDVVVSQTRIWKQCIDFIREKLTPSKSIHGWNMGSLKRWQENKEQQKGHPYQIDVEIIYFWILFNGHFDNGLPDKFIYSIQPYIFWVQVWVRVCRTTTVDITNLFYSM